MKATFDLPEQLYREVKAKTANEGRTVREVVVTLFQQWLEAERTSGASTPRVDWRQQVAPLAHLVAEEAVDHSLTTVRESITRNWDEPR